MTDWTSLVTVGRIVRPHGIKGQVVIAPETDFGATRFEVGAALSALVNGELRTLVVTSSFEHQGRWVVAFDGVPTMNDAEMLRNVELRVAPEALPPLAEGRYYVHDLAGCEVVTVGGKVVGRVDRVELDTGTPVLVVEGPRGEVLVPLADTICTRVDVAAKVIEIDPPDGLIELNDR
ncbi:MAG TPA: ribosome maturation factor RimM [Vicinamibacterales bacterium]|nr:ribosome maturation factor RimM [Vicinamibacterales bacterium]